MPKKIFLKVLSAKKERIRVRLIKAPLVNTFELRNVIASRARAVVL